MIWCTWLLLVNLGMIWCFGFFFLELLNDRDEESQQRCEALTSLDDVGRKLGSVPTTCVPTICMHACMHVLYAYAAELDHVRACSTIRRRRNLRPVSFLCLRRWYDE